MNDKILKLEQARDILYDVWLPVAGETNIVYNNLNEITEDLESLISDLEVLARKYDAERLQDWINECAR